MSLSLYFQLIYRLENLFSLWVHTYFFMPISLSLLGLSGCQYTIHSRVYKYKIWCQSCLFLILHNNSWASGTFTCHVCWFVWLPSCVFPILTVLFLTSLAILVCMENSFWHQLESISFMASFQNAFQLYIKSGTRDNLETSIKELGDYPPPGSNALPLFKSSLLELLLKHRLSRFNYILSFHSYS